MALKFLERFRLIKQAVTGKLPFVHLFGYEKTYGAAQPQDFKAQVDAYKSWAFACANRNAFSIAKCKLRLYKKGAIVEGEQQLTEIYEHPFLELMNNVNPFFNKFELWTLSTVFLELTGNSYWWMPRNVLRIPVVIWSLPSHWIKVIPSKTEFVSGYAMTVPGEGKPIFLPAEEVVHFKYPSPFNLFYGTGPLYAAAYGIDLNEEIKRWGINYFKNNAQPSGVLYSEEGISPENATRLRDQWNYKHRGAENAGKLGVLTAGLKYQQIGSSLKDAKFEDVSREIRDEILAIFGVPASKLGLVEDVNRANAEANDYTYQKETVLPRLQLIEEKINEKIMPIYDVNLIVKFDNPVPEDKAFRLTEQMGHIQSGYSSIDDERLLDKKEPYNAPETSAPLIPFGMMPAGADRQEYAPASPFGEEEGKDKEKEKKSYIQKRKDRKWEIFATLTAPKERYFTKTMRGYFETQHSEVMRNIARYRSVSKDIKAGFEANIIFNMNEANDKLKGLSLHHIRESFIAGFMLGMQDTDSSIDWNLYEPNILRVVDQRMSFFVEKTNQATADLLGEAIKTGVEKGESIDDIAKRVDRIFQYSEDYRSIRTAQTEVIGATNGGQLQAYIETGTEEKEWLTARDERVRASHLALEAQGPIGITQPFVTIEGDKLLYPGDRSQGASAGAVINCRCTILPVRRKGA